MQSYREKEKRMRVVQRNHVNIPNFKSAPNLLPRRQGVLAFFLPKENTPCLWGKKKNGGSIERSS
jgi:hypothetical protein